MINRHIFTLNPQANGGEQVTLSTHIERYGNDKKLIALGQELEIQSYGQGCAKIYLGAEAALTPNKLRKLADELEERIQQTIYER